MCSHRVKFFKYHHIALQCYSSVPIFPNPERHFASYAFLIFAIFMPVKYLIFIYMCIFVIATEF